MEEVEIRVEFQDGEAYTSTTFGGGEVEARWKGE